jgi:hypothetical protein
MGRPLLAATPVMGFADVLYKNEKGAHPTFEIGQLDFYYSTKIDEKTSFLAEIVYESGIDNGQQTTGLDIERVSVQYFASPWLKIAAGRFHTALGYWNDNFHHGSWLQTSISRPRMYSFEDSGGFLPVHTIGLEFRGEGQVGTGLLGYIANVGNGRGPQVDPPQMVEDADIAKSFNLVLYYSLPDFDNLRFGVTYYQDTLPETFDNTHVLTRSRGHETISGAHILWEPGSQFQILSEYMIMNHSFDGTENANKTSTGYVLASYKMGNFTPFVKFDSINADKTADTYTSIGDNYQKRAAGLRYELSSRSALKVESYYETTQNLASNYGTLANWSFTF